MAEFTCNNIKNVSIGHTLFELNCGYHPRVLLKDKINFHLKFYYTNKLAKELKELIEICYQNLFYIQELQEKANNKKVKSCSCTLDKKVEQNNKYIKI